MTQGYGDLLGLFPVNMLHNVVHLLFGLWGMLAYRSLGGAKDLLPGVAIIYAVLTVLGLIPATQHHLRADPDLRQRRLAARRARPRRRLFRLDAPRHGRRSHLTPVAATWTKADAGDLLAFVERIGEEGLDPADYRPAALRGAIDSESDASAGSRPTPSFG
jgi:hypothetical protein